MEGVSNSYRIQDSGYRMQNTGYRIQLQDMQKDNLFTQTWFEPNMFYPKKGVNYDKSNPRQNSIKGPKDTTSAKKCQKVT